MNILITGGTDGMGRVVARHFADSGARILLAGRNRERGEATISELVAESGNPDISYLQTDLSLVSGMRELAGEVNEALDRLDILIHSAGGHFPKRRIVTLEGLEFSFAVLTLARWFLTGELLSLLRSAGKPRVLSMAGGGKGYRDLDFDNLQGEKRYSMFGALGRAAPLNELLTLEQMSRYEGITFYNYGPGLVRTRALMSTLPRRLLFSTAGRLISRSPEAAADDIVKLLTDSKPAGFYSVSLKQNDPGGAGTEDDPGPRLWEYLERLIGDLPGDQQPV
ncbi:SDR family NAD(P)-dependent oxidoreductase [Candidatus Zixiibacteriota bacterium]